MKIRTIAFDEHHEQIAVATPQGFIIYDAATSFILYQANFGGTTCLALPTNSNLVAVSGDASTSGFPPIAIVLWDCHENRASRAWMLEKPIDALFFRRDCLVAVTADHINFYDGCNFFLSYATANSNPGRTCLDLCSSAELTLVVYPSPSGDHLIIADYHDPGDALGSIPIAANQISLLKFDQKGELLAVVLEDAKYIQLWSVLELRMVAKFKRGLRATEVSGIAFDNLSTVFVMTTRRGTLHVFLIPNAGERTPEEQKGIRSKFSFELPKGTDFCCEFDIAGYTITGISTDGVFRQLRLDVEKGTIVPITEQKLDS
jgi:hypothetical protein